MSDDASKEAKGLCFWLTEWVEYLKYSAKVKWTGEDENSYQRIKDKIREKKEKKYD